MWSLVVKVRVTVQYLIVVIYFSSTPDSQITSQHVMLQSISGDNGDFSNSLVYGVHNNFLTLSVPWPVTNVITTIYWLYFQRMKSRHLFQFTVRLLSFTVGQINVWMWWKCVTLLQTALMERMRPTVVSSQKSWKLSWFL